MTRLLRAGTLAVLALLLVGMIAFGAEPSTIPTEVLEGGDLRSDGAGPGLVGNPLLILLAVVGLGLITAALTVVIVRLARRD